MRTSRWILIVVCWMSWLGIGFSEETAMNKKLSKAIFAGGCFWCMEPPYDKLPGIVSTTVGYIGGTKENPTYEEVSSGTTGHTEAIEVVFDGSKIHYEELLNTFWKNIDPTVSNRQFADSGTQYRTGIFYHDEEQRKIAQESKERLEQSGKYDGPIVTEITKATTFYPAEEYHQEFYKKNPLRYDAYKEGSGRAEYLRRKK